LGRIIKMKDGRMQILQKRPTFFVVLAIFSLGFFINESSLIGSSENQPDERIVGYELLDSNQVLHIWNTEDDYYFNATSGMQFTNHYEQYWSKNVFCGGYYDGNEWIKLACVDELPFTWNIRTDNETYINVTGYRDVSHGNYDVRVALRYHLKEHDTRLSVQPYMKNIGSNNIPVELGFAWHIRNIQVDMQEEDNILFVHSLEGYPVESLHNLDKTYHSTLGSMFITNNNTGKHIFMSWNKNLTHLVQAKPSAGQYNSPVTLGIKVGTLAIGQEKTTTIKWIDAEPDCEHVGTDGNEDVCFYASLTSNDFTNYSDATLTNSRFPKFKVTYSNSMPVGCSWDCRLYRQSEVGGSWRKMDTLSNADCYNAWVEDKCDTGYCEMRHTETINERSRWDLCILYSGALCAEDGNVYCGIGSQVGGVYSSRADARVNMSYNQDTPEDYDVTTLEFTNSSGVFLNVSFNTWMGYDLDGLDRSIINWYADDVFFENDNITYTTAKTEQVNADSTESCGTWFGFLPFANVIDNNWATKGLAGAGNIGYGFMNYTKIADAYAVDWEVKDDYSWVNVSVPHDCFNTYDDLVSFRVVSYGTLRDAVWECLNGTSWAVVKSDSVTSQALYEESVHWRTQVQDNDVILNVTDLCYSNITYEVQSWDDSYFSPTDVQVWNWSNISYDTGCLAFLYLFPSIMNRPYIELGRNIDFSNESELEMSVQLDLAQERNPFIRLNFFDPNALRVGLEQTEVETPCIELDNWRDLT